MSNLYKQRYVVANNSNTRIINSNDRVEERMQELRREMVQKLAGGQSADGFVEGLSMELVDARQEAEEILAEARSRAEAVLAQANEQAVSIRKQAEENGYETGYNSGIQEGNEKAAAELAVQRSRMEEEQRRMEEEYRQKIEELEPYLVDIVADVFEKVFHVQVMADASLKERQCMIETDSGIFDCGSDVQLEHLIKALRSLSL